MTSIQDTVASPVERLLQTFKAMDGHTLNGTNTHVQRLRQESIAHVRRLGLPTRRLEAYKYTPVERAFEAPLHIAAGDVQALATEADVDAMLVPGLDAHVAVLVNGTFQPQLSRIGELPGGVILTGLRAALAEHAALVDAHLGAHTRAESDVFSALNTAFLADGLFLYVPRSTTLGRPVHIVHFIEGAEHVLAQPRVLVVAGDNAEAKVLETTHVAAGTPALVNAVAEFSVGADARVTHYRVQDEGPNVSHITATEAHQQRQSLFSTTTVTLSGQTVRNNARIVADAEFCESHLYGLFLVEGKTHVDNATLLDHAKPNCESTELYKGILWDEARGVFNGKILVRPDAQKINAYQSSRAILMSDRAEMYSKPELEIYADDVKCSHGAATGKLDPEALFYLRSRGLDMTQARALMLLAFARDVTDTITLEPLHDWLDEQLQERFIAG